MSNYEVTYLLITTGEISWMAFYIYFRNKAPLFQSVAMRIALATGCPVSLSLLAISRNVPRDVLLNWGLLSAISVIIWCYILVIQFPVKTLKDKDEEVIIIVFCNRKMRIVAKEK